MKKLESLAMTGFAGGGGQNSLSLQADRDVPQAPHYSVTRPVEPLLKKLRKRTTILESFFIGNAFAMDSSRHSEKPENQAGKLRRFSDYSESHNRESSALRLRLGGRNDGVLLPSPKGRGTEGEGAALCSAAEGKIPPTPLSWICSARPCPPLAGREARLRSKAPAGSLLSLSGLRPSANPLCKGGKIHPRPTGEGARRAGEGAVKAAPRIIGDRAGVTSGATRRAGSLRDTAHPLTNNTQLFVRHSPKFGFTLAEVLITLGIIGVVAALTLPTLNAAISKKVRAEQIRTVKYKFTKATTKMASLGLIGPYNSSSAFVAELQKHLKIIKVCTSSNLRACWPYDTIILEDGKEYDVTKITSGKAFKMTSSDLADYTSPNIGIITGDGTPMIISYNTKCEALDPLKTYTWSTEDNKPVSNATSNCVAAIFEVNGTRRPNKFREDVVAFNANGLGSSCAIELASGKCFTAPFTPTPMTKAECEAAVAEGKLGIKACYRESDYWAGAVKQCGGTSNMPSRADLASIASAIYDGNPSIGANEYNYSLTYTSGTASSLGLPEPTFSLWASEENDCFRAAGRAFNSRSSGWYYSDGYRDNSDNQAVCLGD